MGELLGSDVALNFGVECLELGEGGHSNIF